MTPPVDHPTEERTALLRWAAERRRRKARAALRRNLYRAGILTLLVATTALGILNLNLERQATAQSQPPTPDNIAPVNPARPTPAPVAEPKSEPAIAPEPVTPKPPTVTPKPPIKRDPSRTAIATKRVPAPIAPPAVTPKPAAFIEAKSDPAIVKPPAVASPVSPPPELPKVAEPRAPAPSIIHKPLEQRHRDLESSQSTDPAGRVAGWMTETYGKRDAEQRAESAVSLYPETDARTEHWRKVLEYLREPD
jgi:hypothetical protein